MNVHKILMGEGAEMYLPFALSKLRALKLLNSPQRVQRYSLSDATVLIEYNPFINQHFVRIERAEGTLGYEFFSTLDSVTAFPIEWWATEINPAFVDDKWVLRPRKLSTSFTDEPSPIVPRDPLSRAVNGQRNPQYHWWPWSDDVKAEDAIRTKPYFMTSTNGVLSWQSADLDFQNFMGSYTTVDGASAVPHDFLTDVGVDVQPTLYEKKKAVSGFPFPVVPNWPRRAACMEVSGRRFVIMTDMQSNFYAYPESHLTGDPVFTAFDESRAQKVMAADYIPSGIAIPSMSTMHVAPRGAITEYGDRWAAPPLPEAQTLAPYADYPGSEVEPGADERRQYQKHHYIWDFHPSGTRAVAVVHVAEKPTLLRGDGVSGETVYCLREYGPQYKIYNEDVVGAWVAAAGGAEPVSVSERAVLEVEFHITITGEKDTDFEFAVTEKRTLSNYWYFDAQYAYCDSRLEALGVLAGDLLTDEIRLFGDVEFGNTTPTVFDEFVVTRNQDRGFADVQSVCVAQNRPYRMLDEFRWIERDDLPTYDGDPPAIYRYYISEYPTPGANALARMVSSDLRSLSKAFHQSRNGDPFGLHVIAFGETRHGSAIPHTTTDSLALGHGLLPAKFLPSGSPWLNGRAVNPDSLEAAHCIGLHRVAWDHITYRYGYDASVHSGICTHPDGHFAVFAFFKNPYNPDAPVEPFDLIEYRRVELDPDGNPVETFERTTHVEAFSKVFEREFDLPAFVAAITTETPMVIQRFASWRNIKLPKLAAGQGQFGMNPDLSTPST